MTSSISSNTRDQVIRNTKKDILQQINELYVRKDRVSHQLIKAFQVKTDAKYLIPTKATLFGLDVRFRAVDKQLEDEKSKTEYLVINAIIERRNAFKARSKKRRDTNSIDEGGLAHVQNRHHLPIPQEVLTYEKNHVNKSFAHKNAMRETSFNQPFGCGIESDLKPKMYQTSAAGFNKNSYLSNQSPKSIYEKGRRNTNNENNITINLSTEISNQIYMGNDKLPSIEQNSFSRNQAQGIGGVSGIDKSKEFANNTSITFASFKKSFEQGAKDPNKTFHSCFDDIINQRLSLGVGKNQSFLKVDHDAEKAAQQQKKQKAMTEKEQQKYDEMMLKKHEKKLLRSPKEMLMQATKTQLNQVNDKIKQQVQLEKTLERQKQYNLQNTLAQKEQLSFQPQAIKRAKLFNDEDYLSNLREIEENAKRIEDKLEEEEQEKKFAQAAQKRIAAQTERLRQEAIQRLQNQEKDKSSKDTKKVGNLIDDDAFLFGDTIKIDYSQFTGANSKPIKRDQSHSPLGKRNIQDTKYRPQHKSLHVNIMTIKKSSVPTHLTHSEKDKLKALISEKILKYQSTTNRKNNSKAIRKRNTQCDQLKSLLKNNEKNGILATTYLQLLQIQQ